MDTEQVDRVIAALYEAAADPTYWTDTLALLTKSVGGLASNFIFADTRPNGSFVAVTHGYSEEALRLYNQYYGAIDETRKLALKFPPGHLVCTEEHFDDRFVGRSEYYNDFLLPQGGRYMVGTRLYEDDTIKVSTSIHRNKQQGPFSPEQLAIIRRVYPHLLQATRLAYRLNQMRAQNASLASALDTIPWGIVITRADGHVVRANAAAVALTAKCDGLSLCGNKLETSSAAATQALQKLIREACRASRGRGGEPAGSLAVTRPSDGSRLMVFVAPLSEVGGISLGVSASGAIVFIANPATRRIAPTDAVAQAFGLTPAEARLAVALASGNSLEEIADRHRLSKNTVRVQLQSAFAKTGTRRQTELATLILGLPTICSSQASPNGRAGE